MQDCSLTAHELACRRGDRLLFRKLDFSLCAGQSLHITGPNGIGKSSLMRILAGLLRPFAGTYMAEGKVALVDEHLALDLEWPLGRALKFWEGLDGCTDSGNPLAVMELEHLLDIPVRFLSAGQRKRAAFARLLCAPHDIWLLDEPYNGLDRQARARLDALIRQQCDGGGICVIASHQPLDFDAERLAIEDFAP